MRTQRKRKRAEYSREIKKGRGGFFLKSRLRVKRFLESA
jgi:hypothetical protein